MKSCLKQSRPPSPRSDPTSPTPVVRPGPTPFSRKCVSFCGEKDTQVFVADDWDRTPARPAGKLSYQDILELKELRLSLPRAKQPPETASYFPPMLDIVGVGLVPLFDPPAAGPPASPAPASSPASPAPVASPSPLRPVRSPLQSPSPPATPPPVVVTSPAKKKFSMAFLPLLESPSTQAPPPDITPPCDTDHPESTEKSTETDQVQSADMPLPTPDTTPLLVTTPLEESGSVPAVSPIPPGALDAFPHPPATLLTLPLSADVRHPTSPTDKPFSSPSTCSPSPDSHPNLHSYFPLRVGVPALFAQNSPGLPDSPFVDPTLACSHSLSSAQALPHNRPSAFEPTTRQINIHLPTSSQPHTAHLKAQLSPALAPPSPLTLGAESPEYLPPNVDLLDASVTRRSSLRKTAWRAESDETCTGACAEDGTVRIPDASPCNIPLPLSPLAPTPANVHA